MPNDRTPSLPQAVLTDAEIDRFAAAHEVSRSKPLDDGGLREHVFQSDGLGNFAHALIDAALSRMGGEAVAAGWKLVPVNLTDEMRSATSHCETEDEAWSAMLAAAPTAPAQQAADVQGKPLRCDGCGKTIAEHDPLLNCPAAGGSHG